MKYPNHLGVEIMKMSTGRPRSTAVCFLPILFVIVAVLIAGGLARVTCNAASESPEVRVGSELEFPPYAVVGEDGLVTGFSIELIKAVADAMGLSIKISTGSWDSVWNALVAGRLDVLPIVAKLPERQPLVDFSLPHTETYDTFFVRKENPLIQNIEGAKGKEIVVMRSDAAHHALMERDFQGTLILVDTIPEGLSLISSGKHDALLCSKLIGTMAVKKHGLKGLTAGPPIPDYKRVFSFAVKKGDTGLLEQLNQGLLIIKTNGEYDRIYEKWLTADDPWRNAKKYFFPALAVVLAITLIFGFWLAMLKLAVRKRTRELAESNEMLRQAREGLEESVVQRTAELSHTNAELHIEITERKRAEAESRESQARLDLALRSAHMGVWHWDIIENIRWFDDQVCHLLGIDPAKFTGTADEFFNAVHPDDRSLISVALARTIELDGPYEREYRVVHQDGGIHHVASRGRVVRDDDGRPVRINGIIWDITERKRMEEELRRSNDELELRVQERTTELQITNRALKEYAVKLERLNEELRDFAFIASHDLQEPVRKIQVFGDMLRRKCDSSLDEQGKDCIMRMAGSAKQMGALVQALLDYSRLTTRLAPPEHVDLSGIIREIVHEFRLTTDIMGGRIEVGEMPVIEADGAQIRHLFRHLILNSIKFSKTDEPPVIKVRGQSARDYLKILVEDNGIGFDEGYLDRIFRPFQQLHEMKGQYEGTGMGLAICRKIVELHGGTLTARSQPGVGSTFIVSFPSRSSKEGLS